MRSPWTMSHGNNLSPQQAAVEDDPTSLAGQSGNVANSLPHLLVFQFLFAKFSKLQLVTKHVFPLVIFLFCCLTTPSPQWSVVVAASCCGAAFHQQELENQKELNERWLVWNIKKFLRETCLKERFENGIKISPQREMSLLCQLNLKCCFSILCLSSCGHTVYEIQLNSNSEWTQI